MSRNRRKYHKTHDNNGEENNTLDSRKNHLNITGKLHSFYHNRTDKSEPNRSNSCHPMHVIYKVWLEYEKSGICSWYHSRNHKNTAKHQECPTSKKSSGFPKNHAHPSIRRPRARPNFIEINKSKSNPKHNKSAR